MASKSLGPFPKTISWHQIVSGSGGTPQVAERLIAQLQEEYEGFTRDDAAFACITLLVALPVCTRASDPQAALNDTFGIPVAGASLDQLLDALDQLVPGKHPAKAAARSVLIQISEGHAVKAGLFPGSPWTAWREYDGSGFCDLARAFFSELNHVCFSEALGSARLNVPAEVVTRFAQEMSLITRSFSARWFNACARFQRPESGSIRWYLGHCMGKLDLELARESADWVEPAGNPWRRKKPATSPSLTF